MERRIASRASAALVLLLCAAAPAAGACSDGEGCPGPEGCREPSHDCFGVRAAGVARELRKQAGQDPAERQAAAQALDTYGGYEIERVELARRVVEELARIAALRAQGVRPIASGFAEQARARVGRGGDGAVAPADAPVAWLLARGIADGTADDGMPLTRSGALEAGLPRPGDGPAAPAADVLAGGAAARQRREAADLGHCLREEGPDAVIGAGMLLPADPADDAADDAEDAAAAIHPWLQRRLDDAAAVADPPARR